MRPRDEFDEIEAKAYAQAEARGIKAGARVRIIGPDAWSVAEDYPEGESPIGSLGHISYTRGPWQSWVYVDAWNGLGTTFDNTSLEAVDEKGGTAG